MSTTATLDLNALDSIDALSAVLSAAADEVEATEATTRVKRKYTVTADRPKNVPNSSTKGLRQISNANRITGTTTAVYDLNNVEADEDTEAFIIEPSDGSEDRWLVACHDHEFSTTLHTLLDARRIAFLPPLWCPDCAVEVPMTDEFDDTDGEPIVRAPYAPVH